MQSQYYIADLHLGHGDGILRFRGGFENWEAHDQFVVDQINETVNPTDSLYIAGDAVITDKGIKYLQKIACRNIYLIPGNHCGERTQLASMPYKRITGALTVRVGNYNCIVTHIPIHPSELDRWDINIHGHLHDQSIIDPRYLCISCEQSKYIPQTKAQMLEKIKKNFERYATTFTGTIHKSPFGLKTPEEILDYLQNNG